MVPSLADFLFLQAMAAIVSAVTLLTYDEQDALLHVDYARIAFCDKSKVENWSCGTMCDAAPSKPINAQYFGRPSRDVRGYVANFGAKKCVLAFRGSVSFANWISDFTPLLTSWPPEWRASEWCPGCQAHMGFVDAWENVRSEVLELMRIMDCSSVSVVGHSLGGAVATLAAIDLRVTSPGGLVVKKIYTFGSPRVGNKAFADVFDRSLVSPSVRGGVKGRVMSSWRVVFHHDPVPHLRMLLADMTHVATEVYYHKSDSSEYKICDGGEDPTCSKSLWPLQLLTLDHRWYLNKTFAHQSLSSKCIG
eukprot:TRINITY_DN62877_c0_g1_i1.p1 TRINITY_DN62877_c0_g1~~TRINITY_DN62877_c0_g1_i1.p1  ORF type:complete len:306 (+),score=44.01 TRINITY_DN62877_c0_g1_i1:82-999(+)